MYTASQAGVAIDLIVRGICCLRAGVRGLSPTIRVRSILGRYLERSASTSSPAGPGKPHFLIGSADLMPRNLDRRVEVLVPVDTPEDQERLREILAVQLGAEVRCWELHDDRWHPVDDATVGARAALRRVHERSRLPDER